MDFHHVAITVDDLSESIEFYTEKLGFELDYRFELDDLGGKAAVLKLNDSRIELFEFENPKENSDPLDELEVKGIRHIAFKVDDLDEKIQSLEEKGLEFTEPELTKTGENYYTFTNDPNGVAIEFYGSS